MKKDQKCILRLENKIKQLRKDITQVEQINTLNSSRKIRKNTKNLRKKFDIQNENTQKRTPEKLKQKQMVSNNHLKQYKERQKQYHQNRNYVNSPERFLN